MKKQEMMKLDERIAIRIDKQTKDEFMRRLEEEGKNASDIILKWIKSYVASEPKAEVDLQKISEELESLKRQVADLERLKQEVAMMRSEFMAKSAA
jgi:antitoxin component of RelBE/YafQ-DinJ toxin-antitoxin module